MDPVRIQQLLDLIDRASVWPPDVVILPPQQQAIIDKAKLEIDAELAA